MSRQKNITIVLLLGLAAGLCAARAVGGPIPVAQQSTPAHGAWEKEFDDVCSRTQDAMSHSIEELTVLIRRCDALLPQVEKLDDTRKKIYKERLRMCRGLYAYVLESKESEKK